MLLKDFVRELHQNINEFEASMLENTTIDFSIDKILPLV